MGLAGGTIPTVLGTGGIQQLLQLAAGRGIGRLDGGKAILPCLLYGGVVGQLVQLHRCRRLNSGFAALQRVAQQRLVFLIEVTDIAHLGRQLRDTLLCQCIQLLTCRIAGLLQSRRCRRVHIRCRITLREGGCQIGQCLSGVGVKDVHFFCRGSLIQLQLPALIGGQQRSHVLLRILFIGNELVIEILLCLLRVGDDLTQFTIFTQILQPDIINVRNGSGVLDLSLCRGHQRVDLRLLLSRVHAAVHIDVKIGKQLLAVGVLAAQYRGKLLLTFLHQRICVAVRNLNALYVRQHDAVIEDALLRTIDLIILVAGTDQLCQQLRRGADLIPAAAGHGESGHHAGHTGRVVAVGIRHVHYAPQRIGGRALHVPDLAAVPFAYDTAYALRCGITVIRHIAGIIGVGEGAGASQPRVVGRADIAHDTTHAIAHGGRTTAADRPFVQHVYDDNVQHAAGNIFIQADPAHDTAHTAFALNGAAVLAQTHLCIICQQAHDAAHTLNAIDRTLAAVGAVADHTSLTSHTYDAARVVDILPTTHRAVVIAAVYDGVYRRFTSDAARHSTVIRASIADIHRRGALKNGTHTVACNAARSHIVDAIAGNAYYGDRAGYL